MWSKQVNCAGAREAADAVMAVRASVCFVCCCIRICRLQWQVNGSVRLLVWRACVRFFFLLIQTAARAFNGTNQCAKLAGARSSGVIRDYLVVRRKTGEMFLVRIFRARAQTWLVLVFFFFFAVAAALKDSIHYIRVFFLQFCINN